MEEMSMIETTRRKLMTGGAAVASVVAIGIDAGPAAAQNGFAAASTGAGGPPRRRMTGPGFQGITALCEVTGGGEKVYGVAIEYDAPIDPASLDLTTFAVGVVPAARGFRPGMPQSDDKNATSGGPVPRPVAAIYTNAAPALRPNRKSVAGPYVIAEFAHDPDLSLPTGDSDKVVATQNAAVRTVAGATYPAATKMWSNAGDHGSSVVIRGVDAWEQNHWWWDDTRSAWLEYSMYLPKSFLKPGGEKKAYPLVLAVTHSGTSYDGTCAQTLTEQCIATIWSLPENQAEHECVVVTPRYERTTMNDYWEHTSDVENTQRLIDSLVKGGWNYGNPNLPDRADKVLRIDPTRVYCTGWSMGAMTSLWLMAKHPGVYAGGLVIAGQQRPADLVQLALQNVLIITGSEDDKATAWNERCVPVWQAAGGKVTRPAQRLDPALVFPVDDQRELTRQVDAYLAKGGNITFLTFQGVDHMGSARKFFYVKAARDWLFRQVRA